MEIKLTHKESEEYFLNALCNSAGVEGCFLTYEKEDYKSAASKLKSPCREDVLMQILKDGNKLTMVDEEGEGDMTRHITMEDVYERVSNTDAEFLLQMKSGEDDAWTADAIIQTVFFNEIVFG